MNSKQVKPLKSLKPQNLNNKNSIKLLHISLIFFWASPFHLSGQVMPNWFNEPYLEDHVVGVGISERFREAGKSSFIAKTRAKEQIYMQLGTKIVSGFADVSNGVRSLTSSFDRISIDSSLIEIVDDKSYVIDSLDTESNFIVMMAMRFNHPSKIDVILKGHPLNREEKPKWITTPPVKKGFIYGVGYGPSFKDMHNSWKRSFEEALKEIAGQKISTISSMEKHTTKNFSYQTTWIEESLDTDIRNSFILARWLDDKKKIYYTLVEHRTY